MTSHELGGLINILILLCSYYDAYKPVSEVNKIAELYKIFPLKIYD